MLRRHANEVAIEAIVIKVTVVTLQGLVLYRPPAWCAYCEVFSRLQLHQALSIGSLLDYLKTSGVVHSDW